jgi:hypothetical protein
MQKYLIVREVIIHLRITFPHHSPLSILLDIQCFSCAHSIHMKGHQMRLWHVGEKNSLFNEFVIKYIFPLGMAS